MSNTNQKPRYVFSGIIILRLNLKEFPVLYFKLVDGMITFLCPETRKNGTRRLR
jgi:hypothetical protein